MWLIFYFVVWHCGRIHHTYDLKSEFLFLKGYSPCFLEQFILPALNEAQQLIFLYCHLIVRKPISIISISYVLWCKPVYLKSQVVNKQVGMTWNSITQATLFKINISLPSHHVNLCIPNWDVFIIVQYMSNFRKLVKYIFSCISISLDDFYWQRYHFHNLSDLTDIAHIIGALCVYMHLCVSYV